MLPLFGILTPATGPSTASAEAPLKKSFFGGAGANRETTDPASPASREDGARDGSSAPPQPHGVSAHRELRRTP